jgi:hypothetical protein
LPAFAAKTMLVLMPLLAALASAAYAASDNAAGTPPGGTETDLSHTHAERMKLQPAAKNKPALATFSLLSFKADRDAEIEVIEGRHGLAVRVLAGSVIVRNHLDRSVIRIGAGTSYEIIASAQGHREPQAFVSQAAEMMALFETKTNTSFLYGMEKDKPAKAEIINPPCSHSYWIGSVAARRFPMSQMLAMHFPPAGVVNWEPPKSGLAQHTQTH